MQHWSGWLKRPTAIALSSLVLAGCGLAPGALKQGEDPEATAQRDIISALVGDSPNFAQMSNGDMMTAVSRDYGRGAKAGALMELYYPDYAKDHLWDSYVGVTVQGQLKWAHQIKLVNQRLVPDTGMAVSTFEGPGYELKISDLVRPGNHAHVRRVSVTNTSNAPLRDLSTTCYAFFTLNHLPGGDTLRFDRAGGALVQTAKGVAVALASDRPATGWQCGEANVPIGSKRDARLAAESGKLNGSDRASTLVTGVNGAVAQALPEIAPGQSAEVTYAIGIAGQESQALAEAKGALKLGWEGAQREDAERWQRFLSQGRMPAMPEKVRAVYRRALITLKQHQNTKGALIAAPTNMDPPYRLVWPRDGSINALTLLEAGYDREAKAFFEFLERLQQSSGGWAINYFPDASRALWDFGTNGNEHDQVGTFPWAIMQVYRKTGDASWLSARWPAVRKACDFLVMVQEQDGLLSHCRDLWELSHDGTWTFSNAAGWAGLVAGAELADRMGDRTLAAKYRQTADKLHAAMERELVVNGAFARGKRKKGVDATLEAANLALGSAWFGAFEDRDPRMKATAALIEQRLSSPMGGIRRYENDTYYDGQAWPVTTGWLALYKLTAGDRAGAQRLFDIMTGYAYQTDSLMLGEQFDEAKRVWVSAFPLAWSEATYVRSTLELYR
ncbi:hypothetical protein J7643_14775 [bacterium]|nr:hypothetical protein [bacterium]